jgi:hypothetical protein
MSLMYVLGRKKYHILNQLIQLGHSLRGLYESDYRLRFYILKQLENVARENPTDHMFRQLALCYKPGFGCPDEHQKLDALRVNKVCPSTSTKISSSPGYANKSSPDIDIAEPGETTAEDKEARRTILVTVFVFSLLLLMDFIRYFVQ